MSFIGLILTHCSSRISISNPRCDYIRTQRSLIRSSSIKRIPGIILYHKSQRMLGILSHILSSLYLPASMISFLFTIHNPISCLQSGLPYTIFLSKLSTINRLLVTFFRNLMFGNFSSMSKPMLCASTFNLYFTRWSILLNRFINKSLFLA